MRVSRLLPVCLAGLGFSLAIPAVSWGEGWLHHRRPHQWLQPAPSAPVAPGATVSPAPTEVKSEPVTPGTAMPQATAEPPTSVSPLVSAALGDDYVAMTAPGYLDMAAPMNQIRFRFDSAYNFDRPDRAEFFYPKCGCFGFNAPGPRLAERSVDYQEATMYLEAAPTQRFSAFVELPFRFINPEINDNASGIGDIRFGFKAALVHQACQILTFQLKAFAPTGDGDRGLGTDHYSVEPSLLYWRKLGERLNFYAQFGDWIPLDGTDFAGNVLTYGAGLSYTAIDNGRVKVSPIAEVLGWSVLNGKEFTGVNPPANTILDAGGTGILNGKIGVRLEGDRQSIYLGYGHALTDDTWYRDIYRVEYRIKF